MSRLELDASPPPADPGIEIESLVWLRFSVTWNYLSGAPPDIEPVPRIRPVAKPTAPPAMALMSPIASLPLPQPASTEIATSGPGSNPGRADAQWEMVIPKMVRPVLKPVAQSIAVAPAPAPAPSTPVENASKRAPAEFSAPALALPEQSRLARSWRLMALLAIISLSIGFTLWVHPNAATRHQREQVDESLNRGGWSRRSILPQGRMMSVYEPSREESDYRIEFGWVPDAKGVGWVFRTRDAGDYYATRISLQQPGARVAVVEHFSVIGGVEGGHSRRTVLLGNGAGLVRVRMDAIGPAFALSLQGSAADYWTDARLDSGPLGFYDERGQRPEVQSLRFTLINRGVARTAAATLP
jgi:hypothetical protein